MPISSLVKGTLAEAAAARGWSQDSQPMAWFGTSWAAYSPLNHTQRCPLPHQAHCEGGHGNDR